MKQCTSSWLHETTKLTFGGIQQSQEHVQLGNCWLKGISDVIIFSLCHQQRLHSPRWRHWWLLAHH